jgi:hypothetical protein
MTKQAGFFYLSPLYNKEKFHMARGKGGRADMITPALGRLLRAVVIAESRSTAAKVRPGDLRMLLQHLESTERYGSQLGAMLARRLNIKEEHRDVHDAIKALELSEPQMESDIRARGRALRRFVSTFAERSYWLSWRRPRQMGHDHFTFPFWDRPESVFVFAAMRACSAREAMDKVTVGYSEQVGQIEFVAVQEKPDDWSPYCDEFPKEDWMPTFPPAQKRTGRPRKVLS